MFSNFPMYVRIFKDIAVGEKIPDFVDQKRLVLQFLVRSFKCPSRQLGTVDLLAGSTYRPTTCINQAIINPVWQ